MASRPLDQFLSRLRGTFSPNKVIGAPGTAVYGGYPEVGEKSPKLASKQLSGKTYSDILANVSIVAAGVRYFLNLTANAAWKFTPAEADKDGMYADMASKIFFKDPRTPWHRIVRKAAMYRMWGYALHEWTTRRRKDGVITFHDIQSRAQMSIEQWDMNADGEVMGVRQRSPQTGRYIYIPRRKMMYVLDDSLNDSPEGIGVFRHLVEPANRLRKYEYLESIGFELDLRGIPIIFGPLQEMQDRVKSGDMDQAEYDNAVNPFVEFIKKHIKNPELGLMLDSITYTTTDDIQRPSVAKKWDIKLLTGSATSFRENASAIERVNREIARILAVEQLLLGSDRAGSYALAKDKTNAFYLMIESTLRELRASVKSDLLELAWMMNGWPEEMMPEPATDAIRFTDIAEISTALRDLATAGVTLLPEDKLVREFFELMDLTPPDAGLDRGMPPTNEGDGE